MNRERAQQRNDPLQDARKKLVAALHSITSDAENIADAVLIQIRLDRSDPHEFLDITQLGPHAADCVRNMPPEGVAALGDYADALNRGRPSSGTHSESTLNLQLQRLTHWRDSQDSLYVQPDIEPLEFSATGAPQAELQEASRTMEQMVQDESMTRVARIFEQISREPSDIKREESEADAALPDPEVVAATQSSEPRPSLAQQTHKFRVNMFSNCRATPGSPASPREHARYDDMRKLVREIMNLPTSIGEKQAFLRAHASNEASLTAMAVAGQNNHWAAASLALGILESETPRDDKAFLLMDHVPAVVSKLGKVKGEEDKASAQIALESLKKAWAPVAHFLRLVTRANQPVMLRHPPSPRHSRICRDAKLIVVGAAPGGELIQCSAKYEIPDLAKYAHEVRDGICLYDIPTGDLDVRKSWFF